MKNNNLSLRNSNYLKSTFYSFILLLTFSTYSFAQQKNNSTTTYFDFIFKSDSVSQNYLITLNAQFMASPVGKVYGATGISTNWGINLARFISRKFYLGINADFKIIPGFFVLKPNQTFINEYNNSRIVNFTNELDSANASIISSAINSGQVYGSTYGNLGIGFAPFPQRFGGILIQVKKGWSSFYVHNVFGNTLINGGGNDKIGMPIQNELTVDISFKPAAFFSNSYIRLNSEKKKIIKSIIITLYYERLNFATAEFNGTTMDKIVSEDFLREHGIDHRFGFKLGMGLY